MRSPTVRVAWLGAAVLNVDAIDCFKDPGAKSGTHSDVAEFFSQRSALGDGPAPEVFQQFFGRVVVTAFPHEHPCGTGDRKAVTTDVEDVELE